ASMNFEAAAKDESVIYLLRCMEDKLLQRGFLVSATGDSDCDVTISFKTVSHQGEYKPFLMIAIDTERSLRSRDADWSGICDYVIEMWFGSRTSLPSELQELLGDVYGPMVTVNGEAAYLAGQLSP
ncbi:MAG: hypothetical protein ABIQ36_12340, partial [Rhodanobacter sp.]